MNAEELMGLWNSSDYNNEKVISRIQTMALIEILARLEKLS